MLRLFSRLLKPDLPPHVPSAPTELNFVLDPYVGDIKRVDLPEVDIVWTYLDPSPNGSQSDLVIMSMVVMAKGRCVIVRGDVVDGKGAGQDYNKTCKVVRNHFAVILNKYPMARFVLIGEATDFYNGVKVYSQDLVRYFGEIGKPHKLYIEKSLPNGVVYGVVTTEPMRVDMLKETKERMKNKQMFISRDLDESVQQRLFRQLEMVHLLSYDPFSSPTTNRKRKSRVQVECTDDLAMAMMSIPYYARTISAEYNTEFDDWTKVYDNGEL